MANGGAAGAGAAAAAIMQAIKASGVLVRVKPSEFQALLPRIEGGLVIHAEGGFFSTRHRYLVSYKGFAFYTKSSEPIQIPPRIETIRAGKIWIPG